MSTTPSDVLRKTYGDDIILFDEQNESTVYHLLKEFVYGNYTYAVLQSDELKKEDEVAVFRVTTDSDGQYELETIEDDDEWETVSELYDEMVFPKEDEL
ncbi:DUF1292 domain-containing protein [Paenibacillus alginolyticus]|jgi:uncharacterized protein YrzB (UPF0473 family)|uniref:DUF1292 domain-containing protein n=1 Tax=Paenibacillus alginolyticus TaxID=59839 RepID=A0ABT4GEB3_9BACL|nr:MULTISPECIES: DUF1292 domain-containing protein [Paenibacillus]MCY9663424.1 DUF1292 domain-containing protein [Paenibacillus alginolyticus]MCY9694532.1 DUF1292 domain-containing protein [Paenibacillus alginolyticus]MEC0142693.1 DUF1292 domain-containing protein [Paenibacillus alginolyticus]